MTITSTTLRNTYTGNGSATVYAYQFRILSKNEIKVTVDGTEQTVDSDYTVSGVGDLSGGNVTFTTAPASSTSIVIVSDPAFTQEVDYTELDAFPADSHEQALDRSAIRDLNLKEQLDRAVLIPSTTTLTSYEVSGTIDTTARALTITTSGIGSSDLSSISSAIDTVFTGLATNDFLKYDGSNWVNRTPTEVRTDISAQPLDSTLTALAGLSTGANKVPYSTGTDTFGQLDFLDEDNMSSNSATALASQQSIKAYVDSSAPVFKNFQFATIDKASNTTTIPYDGTAPTSSEGTEVVSLSITPTSSSNKVLIQASMSVVAGGGTRIAIAALFRGTTCIATSVRGESNADRPGVLSFHVVDEPSTTSATTYSIRFGLNTGSDTWYVNQFNTGDLGGTAEHQCITLTEIVS
jgi:hypothetical protein